MNIIKMIVGLANPIIDYNHTRHNIGAWYINKFAKYHNKIMIEKKNFIVIYRN